MRDKENADGNYNGRHNFTLIWWAEVKKFDSFKCWRECGSGVSLVHCGGRVNWSKCLGNSLELSGRVEIHIPYVISRFVTERNSCPGDAHSSTLIGTLLSNQMHTERRRMNEFSAGQS